MRQSESNQPLEQLEGGQFVSTNNDLITFPSFLVICGVAVISTGRWKIGMTLVVIAFAIAIFNSVQQAKKALKAESKYSKMRPLEILDELRKLSKENSEESSSCQSQCHACLKALAKYSDMKSQGKKDGKQQQTRNINETQPHEDVEKLELVCQEAAYFVLKNLYPKDDGVVSGAISLLALVAKDEDVRQRHVQEADKYGLDIPVKALQAAMKRAKNAEEPEQEAEQLSAELQRRGCLLLGALADGDVYMGTKIVDEGGLKIILDSIDWYRHHEDVANWALWALFVLCYEHPGNKGELVRAGGIQAICNTMKYVPDSLEVARHGIAILFDGLREVRGKPYDVIKIRENALAAGMHDVVYNAMVNFGESMEIMMMGQEMLLATGYRGNKGPIPQYNPVSSVVMSR